MFLLATCFVANLFHCKIGTRVQMERPNELCATGVEVGYAAKYNFELD